MIETLVVYNTSLTLYQCRTDKINSECWCFCNEREHDSLIPRVLSQRGVGNCTPKVDQKHFGNKEDVLFSYRATSEQVDSGLQPFTNLKPQRKLSEILFGLLVFEKLNSQTIIPPSFGWTSLICLFHIQKQQQQQQFYALRMIQEWYFRNLSLQYTIPFMIRVVDETASPELRKNDLS